MFARRVCPVRQQVAYKRYTVTSGDEVCGPELSNKLLGPFSGLFARRVCPVRQQVAHQRWRIASGDVIWLRDKVGQKIAWGSFPACVCQRTCPLSMEWAGPDATPPAQERSGPRNPLRAAWVRPDAQVCSDQARLLDGLPDPARNLSELRCGTKSGPESVGNPAYEPGRAPDPGRNLSEIRFRTGSGPDSVGNLVRGCFGELAGWA